MQFSTENLLTPNQIIADITPRLNDEEYLLFTKGRYISMIQQALEELSFDSLLLELYKDYDMPVVTLRVALPEGAFNVRKVYVFNGEFGSVEGMQIVRFKKNYKTLGYDKGYTANNTDGITDPFISGQDGYGLYWCSPLENGYLVLSPSCANFDKVRIIYNGTLTKVGDTPCVPHIFRQAVKEWVLEQCFGELAGKDPRMYRTIYNDIHTKLYRPFEGTWDKALMRAKSLDTKYMEDMHEYLSKGNW